MAIALSLIALVLAFSGIILSGRNPDPREAWVIAGAIIGALLGASAALKFLVLDPLAELTQVMERAQGGEFLIRAKVRSADEIGQLANSFNIMLARVTDLAATHIDSEVEKEWMQRKLELQEQLAAGREELADRVRELSLLIDVTQAISSSLDLQAVLSQVTEKIGIALGFDEFTLLLYDYENREYAVTETFGMKDEMREQVESLRFSEEEGLIGVMHESRRTVYVPNTRDEPRYLHYKGRRSDDGSVLVVPMIHRGEPVGGLAFNRPVVGAFTSNEIRLLETVATQAALAIINARLYQQTLELSITDPLTGLFNRRELERQLDMEITRSARFHQPFTVVMIDIDHFKKYNDTHGHPMGDRVLIEVARTLKEHVRSVDTLARYGGEEFTVVLPRIDRDRAPEVAEKLRAAVEERIFPNEGTQPLGKITLSIGVASYPHDAASWRDLLDHADIALYNAKDAGRNKWMRYEPGMRAAS
ncbi:MAG: diguanylate cyclase [Deltaproteobacteria bacterium]|nr:diguanylate cyclase [Deltaproteobacteria bacterium]